MAVGSTRHLESCPKDWLRHWLRPRRHKYQATNKADFARSFCGRLTNKNGDRGNGCFVCVNAQPKALSECFIGRGHLDTATATAAANGHSRIIRTRPQLYASKNYWGEFVGGEFAGASLPKAILSGCDFVRGEFVRWASLYRQYYRQGVSCTGRVCRGRVDWHPYAIFFLQTRIAIPRYFSQSYGAYFKMT